MRGWTRTAWVICGAMSVACGLALADAEHATTSADSPEFQRLKQLAGRWMGTVTAGHNQGEPVEVEYRVTSGGSAVIETLFPGTPHEMVSVYTDHGGRPNLTHYCMLGNQPRLTLTAEEPQTWTFTLAEPSEVNVAAETHMHALTVAWPDADHLTQAWTLYESGRPTETTRFSFTRAR